MAKPWEGEGWAPNALACTGVDTRRSWRSGVAPGDGPVPERIRGGPALGLLAIFVAFLAWAPASAGISVQVKSDEAADAPVVEEVELYGESHALVLGLDAYSAGWPRLKNGVNDASRVAKALEEHGFEVTFATDLDAEGLRSALKEFFVLKGAAPDSRLLVWFAGHGQSLDGEGFLVPVDAPPPGDPAFALYALPMRDFGTLVRLAKSKHVLAIFDSCFSGTIFEARAGIPPAAITQATLQPVREFLSSGDSDQTVADNGTFRELFLRALRGEDSSDANGDGYLTGSELGAYMADRVTNLTGGAQTPRFGKLLDVNYDRGDFVFVLPGGATRSAQPASTAVAATEATRSTVEEATPAEPIRAPGDPLPVEEGDPPLVDACDKYAAQPEDPARVVPGIAFEAINAEKAIARCEAAVAAYPASTRFRYQLGRALARADRFEEAAALWRQAADAGHLAAMAGLGWLYGLGRGVAQDGVEAEAWYRRAAEGGHAASQYQLGVVYENGTGVDRDGVEAMTWYEAAADAGHPEAQLRLADLLSSGLLGAADPVQALVWYDLAMKSLPSDRRAAAAERRQSLLDTLSADDIAEAESRVAAWRPVVYAAGQP
jgi:TPR repeat protein